MPWNYRVMVQKHEDTTTAGIHEVYYDEQGAVVNWTENAVGVVTELTDPTDTSIAMVFEMMGEALNKPYLDYENGKELP